MYINPRTVDEIFKFPPGIPSKYPPCNATQTDAGDIVVEMAVAGFKPEDIDVSFDGTTLEVSGKSSYVPTEGKPIMQGIAARDFKRAFGAKGGFELQTAEMDQGMLRIVLKSKTEKHVVKVKPVSKETKESLLLG